MRNKPDFIPIKDHPDLFRDPRSQAILQTNLRAKEAYQTQRAERRRIRNGLSEIDGLKADMKEIKELLKLIINKG